MLNAASASERIEDYGGVERRGPGEVYWHRGRLQRIAGFYAQLKRDPLPVLLDEVRDEINHNGIIMDLAQGQLSDSVDNPTFID